MSSSGLERRVRVERGIYRQPNGRYAVCVTTAGWTRFRTVDAETLGGAKAARAPPDTQRAGRVAALATTHLCRGSGPLATARGTPFLHHNISKRVLRRAAVDAGLDSDGGQRVRFHDLRHTFASHLIIDIRLDGIQASRILGHARTSMTLDTYTHLFEQAATPPTSPPSSPAARSPTCSRAPASR